MPLIKTYLKNGRIIETNSRINLTTSLGEIVNVEWKDIQSGERVMHLNTDEVIAITEVIEATK